MVRICDQPNVVSAIEVLTPGYSNESQISGKNITVRDTSSEMIETLRLLVMNPKLTK